MDLASIRDELLDGDRHRSRPDQHGSHLLCAVRLGVQLSDAEAEATCDWQRLPGLLETRR